VVEDRPEFSRPPLNILVNPEEVKSRRPWEVDIAALLDILIGLIERSGLPDLRLCGSAALSSALIYRLKVESLFLFEKIRVKRSSTDRVEPPQILVMPFRYELPSTSLEDLITTLEGILEEILRKSERRPKPSVAEPEPILEVDGFTVQIQAALAEFKKRISELVRSCGEVLFSEYVKDMDIGEKLRVFILLLFSANEGLVRLEQAGEDIKITGVS